jgi:predicted Zn-dependent protease
MIHRRPLTYLCVLGCVSLLVHSACSTTQKTGEPKRERTVLLSDDDSRARSEWSPHAMKKRTVLMSPLDDARVGREAARQVAAEIGLFDDPELNAYVQRIGKKLLRDMPRRSFRYRFAIVDQFEPNAFALPGGYIFISRGLLALVNDEDELANVIGHEITHSARRHAAVQQQMARNSSALVMPMLRSAKLATYVRDMERTADRGGQRLAAAAGYNPMGMATFLGSLEQRERLLLGHAQVPTFFDTHPGSGERASVNAIRASHLRWKRDLALGDTRASHLHRIDGLYLGERPQAGIFQGQRFLHSDLDFQLHFPKGWKTSNSNRLVGAKSPRGDAIVFLEAAYPTADPGAAAERFIEENRRRERFGVRESRPVKIGNLDAWRIQLKGSRGMVPVDATMVFIAYRGSTLRITGVSPSIVAEKYRGRILKTMRSFRPLTEEQRNSIRATRLRIVTARPGEDVTELSRRTGSAWDFSQVALANGLVFGHRFEGGEPVKIARNEVYGPDSP